ncbi:MAG: NAD-dependent deacylase [Gemmatimonadales bacterium]|nr:MAG: NAD-dependent deacylase [Gemmatimonadales bacterium]
MPHEASPDRNLPRARRLLACASHVLVLTGAGVSAESGVPTFRGADGLWRNFKPEDLATPQAFARDPDLVWEWYAWRRGKLAECQPNAAHVSIARWMASRTGVTLVTQNVDGLHHRAARTVSAEVGRPLPDPITLHGSIVHDRCTRCEYRASAGAWEGAPPRCPACAALLRPDVVWFGEVLPSDQLANAARAAAAAEVCLVVGTSGVVYPAAGLAYQALSTGAMLVVVDPGPTALDREAELLLRGPAGIILPQLLT